LKRREEEEEEEEEEESIIESNKRKGFNRLSSCNRSTTFLHHRQLKF
jgi:hypothetical protein